MSFFCWLQIFLLTPTRMDYKWRSIYYHLLCLQFNRSSILRSSNITNILTNSVEWTLLEVNHIFEMNKQSVLWLSEFRFLFVCLLAYFTFQMDPLCIEHIVIYDFDSKLMRKSIPLICHKFAVHSLFTYMFSIYTEAHPSAFHANFSQHIHASFLMSKCILRVVSHLSCRVENTRTHIFLTQNLIKIYVANMPCYVNECALQQNYSHKNVGFITKTAIHFKLADVKSNELAPEICFCTSVAMNSISWLLLIMSERFGSDWIWLSWKSHINLSQSWLHFVVTAHDHISSFDSSSHC